MLKQTISLNKVDEINRFVIAASKLDCDVDLLSNNHYIVNAKSLMGIYSLDLSQPLILSIDSDDVSLLEPFEAFTV